MNKKFLTLTVLAILFSLSMFSVAYASTHRASEYLSYYSAYITTSSNGKVTVNFDVNATSTVDLVGAKTIVLQERENSSKSWNAVKTFSYTSYPNMLRSNAATNFSSVSYNGISGYSYRAKVYFYAEKGGYNTAEYLTQSVVAK